MKKKGSRKKRRVKGHRAKGVFKGILSRDRKSGTVREKTKKKAELH